MANILIDSHQDLAYNMLTFGRDYRRAAAETRQREAGTEIPRQAGGDTLLGWPDYQRGRVAVIFPTLFAAPIRRKTGDWDSLTYATSAEAHERYSAQADAYQRLVDENPDLFRLLRTRPDLDALLAHWETDAEFHPVGLVILMEGAEGVRHPGELAEWWQRGVRTIGPAWAGTRFCGGSGEPGPLTSEGVALLEGMAEIGFTLDLSHMDEQAALQALDTYPGRIIATHANAKALLKGTQSNRHLSDRVIGGLLERGGTMGVMPFNNALLPGWRDLGGRASVTLEHVVAQIDYICQMAGSARQVGLGSDFDGGYGLQMVPDGIDTIADLHQLSPLLAQKGYTEQDIAGILGGNWRAHLERSLPEAA